MAFIKVNLTEVESGDFVTLPEGDFPMEIKSYKLGESKAGKPKITFFCKVLDDEFPGLVSIQCSLQAQALFAIKGIADAAGVDYDEEGFDPDDFLGGQFIAHNKPDEEYNNFTKFIPHKA